MALKFRRTMKVAPGLRLNVGKRGASMRVGGKGAGYTIGTSGQRVSGGIPGTGLHVSEKIGGKRSARKRLAAEEAKPSLVARIIGAIALVAFLAFVFG